MNGHRKLLVHAVNHLVENNHLSLDYNGADNEEKIQIETEILGERSYILCNGIRHGEVRVTLFWGCDEEFKLAPDDYSMWMSKSKSRHMKVACSYWLDRKNGTHLQGKIDQGCTQEHTRDGYEDYLKNLPIPEAKGFEPSGKFYM